MMLILEILLAMHTSEHQRIEDTILEKIICSHQSNAFRFIFECSQAQPEEELF
jgi:hypothetical protein